MFKKKEEKPEFDTEEARSNHNRTEVHVEEFIPFACHYDKNTLLTKNGEMMQVIKVTGFAFECVQDEEHGYVSLRDTIRRSVIKHVDSNRYALWFHTIRRKRDLSTDGDSQYAISRHIDRVWCDIHEWEDKYINEVYVTVLIQGEPLSITDPIEFLQSLNIRRELKQKETLFAKNAEELTSTVDGMLDILGKYGATRLSVTKKEGVYYSEITGLLNKIVNLQEFPAPLGGIDLSHVIPSHQILFGFNMLEVIGETGTHFGTILSVKEYHEVSTQYIDNILQLPQEYIITETFDYTNQDRAFQHYKRQHDIFTAIGDSSMEKFSGLSDFFDDEEHGSVDFGEHQITIMLLDDSVERLEKELQSTVQAFNELGITVVREDIFLEDCYWSQLPGNFEFIRRMTPVNVKRVGAYASLYNYPAGKMNNNHWGPAVTVFKTIAGTPFFFNFHYLDSGHTFIIGPYGSGKTVLMNFLISEATKFNPNIFFLDQNRGSEIFIRALGGEYYLFDKYAEKNQVSFNPLSLPDSEENRGFLYNFIHFLISPYADLTEQDSQLIIQAIDYAYSLPQDQRQLKNVLPKFWQPTVIDTTGMNPVELLEMEERKAELGDATNTADTLAAWYEGGMYAHLFDNVTESVDIANTPLLAMDMVSMVKEEAPVIPIMFYLMHRIYQSLDGTPTIIVLDEAWDLIDNPVFGPRIEMWLDSLTARNAMVIFATEHEENAAKSSLTETLSSKVKTQIYLPNPNADVEHQRIFHLTDNELSILRSLESSSRNFMLKHRNDTVILELNLDNQDFILSVLSSNQHNLAVMEGVFLDAGTEPENWLPVFEQRM